MTFTTWLGSDAAEAIKHGWNICETGEPPAGPTIRASEIVNGKPYGHRPFELQAMSDPSIFHGDLEAWEYVKKAAAAGGVLEQKALDYLRENSLAEYEAIMGI